MAGRASDQNLWWTRHFVVDVDLLIELEKMKIRNIQVRI